MLVVTGNTGDSQRAPSNQGLGASGMDSVLSHRANRMALHPHHHRTME